MDFLSEVNQVELKVLAVSDTIVVSKTESSSGRFQDMIELVIQIQQEFLKNGLLIRGAITYGPHFVSDRITFSHALTLANALEKDVAVYPRVVLDGNLVQLFNEGKIASERESVKRARLLCPQDGVYFTNMAGNCPRESYDCAKEIFHRDSVAIGRNERALAKHRWLMNYLLSLNEGSGLAPYMGVIDDF